MKTTYLNIGFCKSNKYFLQSLIPLEHRELWVISKVCEFSRSAALCPGHPFRRMGHFSPFWRMMSTNICHPCSAFCLALTISFHQVSFLWLLFQQQVQLICWFSSAAPLHSSGPLFLFAFSLEFMTSRYTGSQTPMYETHFLFSLFCVEGPCEKLPSSSSKSPMVWVPST